MEEQQLLPRAATVAYQLDGRNRGTEGRFQSRTQWLRIMEVNEFENWPVHSFMETAHKNRIRDIIKNL